MSASKQQIRSFKSSLFFDISVYQHLIVIIRTRRFFIFPNSTEYVRDIKNMPWLFCIFLAYEKHIFAELVFSGLIKKK